MRDHNVSTYNTNSSGIGVWGSNNVTVDGNRIVEAGGGGWQECISVAGTDTFEVCNNEVLNCHKEGICAKDGSSNGQIYRNHVHHTQRVGIYVDAWDKYTYNIAVYQNVVHDIQDNDGFAIGSEQGGLLENVWVYNNIAYNNRYVGLTIHNFFPSVCICRSYFEVTEHVWSGLTIFSSASRCPIKLSSYLFSFCPWFRLT